VHFAPASIDPERFANRKQDKVDGVKPESHLGTPK
jgi:hypothetical protein